jgi:hypothetical protein
MSAPLLRTLAAVLRVTPRRYGAVPEHFLSGPARTRRVAPAARRSHGVPTYSADPSSSPVAAADPAPGDEPAAGVPVLPDCSAISGAATAGDANGVAGSTSSIGGAFIYGYDAAGNPTLMHVGSCSSPRNPPAP